MDKKKRMKCFLMTALCLLVSSACNGNSNNNQTRTSEEPTNENKAVTVNGDGKILVVFFSHAGDNYSVGNVKVGNTKIVADYISEITGADQFELKTTKYDGMAYDPLCDLAKEEQQKGELPEFEGSIDVSQYDTVFIGGPVWWGTYPQIMFTFFSKYDLNGKTVIPFTTHEGSGLGRCVDDVKKAYPEATVIGEFSIYGHEVRKGKDKVKEWLNGLGL